MGLMGRSNRVKHWAGAAIAWTGRPFRRARSYSLLDVESWKYQYDRATGCQQILSRDRRGYLRSRPDAERERWRRRGPFVLRARATSLAAVRRTSSSVGPRRDPRCKLVEALRGSGVATECVYRGRCLPAPSIHPTRDLGFST